MIPVLLLIALPMPDYELARFPSHEVVSDCRQLNRLYRDNLESKLSLAKHHADEICSALRETQMLYEAWDSLDSAQYYVSDANTAWHYLGELRRLIGPGAYGAGVMPPPVPLWWFVEIE